MLGSLLSLGESGKHGKNKIVIFDNLQNTFIILPFEILNCDSSINIFEGFRYKSRQKNR